MWSCRRKNEKEKESIKHNFNKEAAISEPHDKGREICIVAEYYAETNKQGKKKHFLVKFNL